MYNVWYVAHNLHVCTHVKYIHTSCVLLEYIVSSATNYKLLA